MTAHAIAEQLALRVASYFEQVVAAGSRSSGDGGGGDAIDIFGGHGG
jgi:hypothetical protein